MNYLKIHSTGFTRTTNAILAEKWGNDVLTLTDVQFNALGKTHKINYTTKTYVSMSAQEINSKQNRKQSSKLIQEKLNRRKKLIDNFNDNESRKWFEKYCEGLITSTEYAPYKAMRQSWRDEINTIELELEELGYTL